MEQPQNNNDDEEIPVYDAAVQNLIAAAMATAAAFSARSGYREAVRALIAAALALALAGFLPGLRFYPKDEELVGFFLRKKVRAEAFPVADMMREANVMLHNPMTLAATLPKLGDREWYFFTPRLRKYRHGERPDRGTDGGFWKATGADKAVSLDGETVGFKKSLVFYQNKEREGELDRKTKWIMYEYRLNQPARKQEHDDDMRLDDWVLCSIHEQPQTTRAVVKRKKTEEPPVEAVDEAVDDADMDVNVNTSVAPDENRAVEQPIISTDNVVEADQQYRYQYDQYLEQQQLPSLDVYAYHLPTLDHQQPVIDQQEQYAHQHSRVYQQYDQYLEPSSSSRVYQQYEPMPLINNEPMPLINNEPMPLINTSTSASSSRVYQQYASSSRVYQQYEPMPLINNNNNTSVEAKAEAGQYYASYQQDQMEQLPSLHVADNSLDPGLNFEWLDFLNFNTLDQDQGTTSSVTSTTNNNNSNHARVDIANANTKDNNLPLGHR